MTTRAPLHARGYGGLGDNCYQRPLVRHLARERGELWLSTPYPELYADISGVHPVRFNAMKLRCQGKNMDRTPDGVWATLPGPRMERISIGYALQTPRRGIIEEMEVSARTRIEDWRYDLPHFGPSPVRGPYAIVRPATVRLEWRNYARNPDPAYLCEATDILREIGYTVVVVADIDPPAETLVGKVPVGDVQWIRGELSTSELMALVEGAAMVVGGVGWIVPAALAYRTPAVILCGGLGRHNDPQLLTDPRMGRCPIRFLKPDPYCMCANPKHECPKRIPDFAERFRHALQDVTAPLEVAA